MSGTEFSFDRRTVLFSGAAKKRPRKSGRGPGRPTAAQVEERNRELLERALDLFLERGFEGTTIEAITDSIGMSRRTVYARYGDKITLFKAALQRAIDDWVVPAERLKAAETKHFEATLLNVAQLLTANLKGASSMRLLRIANTEVFHRPEIAAYLWERTAQVTLSYLADLFLRRLWKEPRGLPAAQDAALAFLILIVDGSYQMRAWGHPSEEEMDRQLAYRTRLFLHGARAMK
jgi:AcrR family transcriptional regulator